MRPFALVLACLAACAGSTSAPGPEPATGNRSREVHRLADEYVAAYFERYPEAATRRGIPGTDHGRVTDNSLDALARWQAREDAWLARVRAVESARLEGRPAWVTYGILRELLERSVASAPGAPRDSCWMPAYTGGAGRGYQAVEYLGRTTTMSPVQLQGEVDRYISWPGQATSYTLGNLEIRKLRAEAEDRLGSKFDIRAFHDRVLGNGGVTLPMLRRQVERWVRGMPDPEEYSADRQGAPYRMHQQQLTGDM